MHEALMVFKTPDSKSGDDDACWRLSIFCTVSRGDLVDEMGMIESHIRSREHFHRESQPQRD